MKISMYLMAAALILGFSASAAEAQKTEAQKTEAQKTETQKTEAAISWRPFELAFFPGVPRSTKSSNIRGLKLGIPCTGGNGNIQGVEASFLYSGTSYNNPKSTVEGIQASWFGPSLANDVWGVQATMAFAYSEKLVGFQAAGFAFLNKDSIGCQAGLGSVAKNNFDGFQTGAANVTSGDFNGFQFGAANIVSKAFNGFQCGAFALAGEASGFQCNLANVVTKVCNAFQMGVVNYSASKGIQFGAVNIIKDGVIPVMIIFNCAF